MRKLWPVVVLGLALTACGNDDSGHEGHSTTAAASSSTAPTSGSATTEPAPAPSPVTVDESANGTELQLVPGQRLLVKLPSNPSTGYSWGIQRLDESMLLQDGEPSYQQDDGPAMPGKGGTDTWAFRAVQSGISTLELVYARSWEAPSEANKTFTLTVRVR
ncbi:protease inhibitor I42 family protein [Nocardia sp. NPDC050406]|uniref:protease inhibitor I42 family protein n=1 Tax=Nocardia sp. NPDC050406 TaxID=3364318 RepID=UPI0037A1992D